MRRWFPVFWFLLGLSSGPVASAAIGRGDGADPGGDDFARANGLYQRGQYAEAAGAYERALSRPGGRVSANGFYNLANAYARLGERGRAVAGYRRALLLDPGHADAAANLALVRRQLRVPGDAVLPPALPAWLANRLPSAVTIHGETVGIWTAVLGGWLCVGGLTVALWPGLGLPVRRRGRRWALGAGLPLALLGIGAAWVLGRPARGAARTAVVIARRADAHEQPADNARTVGTLTEGGEVRLLVARGPWDLVALADGRRAYVAADRLEPLVLPSAGGSAAGPGGSRRN